MKMTLNNWTKWAYGIPMLAGVCLLYGCGTMGPEEPAVTVEPVPEPSTMIVGDAVVDSIELPPVQVTTQYVVAKGDTLTQIASAYGLRWQDVAAVNPGMDPNKLRIGQAIHLPGSVDVARKQPVRSAPAVSVGKKSSVDQKSVTYKVQKGDSLSLIAYRYGVKVAALKLDNNLMSDRIRIGQKLQITNPTKSGAASAPKASVKAPAVKAPAVSASKPAVTSITVKPVAPVVVPVDMPPAEVVPVAPPPPAPEVILSPVTPTVVTPVTATEGGETSRNYKVKEDEDLYAVAIRWGVSPNEIKSLNGLTGNEIQPGTTIKIPLQTKQP